MTGYILSILGIVVIGVFLDIIIPSGTINKYIKGIYSIFVVAVIINPLIKLVNKNNNIVINYKEYTENEDLLNHIFNMRATAQEQDIENILTSHGFSNIDIKLNISIANNELRYNSCKINLKNLVISSDKLNINKYEFIKDIIKENTNLTDEEIMFDEWKKRKKDNKMAWKTKECETHWNLCNYNFHCDYALNLFI